MNVQIKVLMRSTHSLEIFSRALREYAWTVQMSFMNIHDTLMGRNSAVIRVRLAVLTGHRVLTVTMMSEARLGSE